MSLTEWGKKTLRAFMTISHLWRKESMTNDDILFFFFDHRWITFILISIEIAFACQWYNTETDCMFRRELNIDWWFVGWDFWCTRWNRRRRRKWWKREGERMEEYYEQGWEENCATKRTIVQRNNNKRVGAEEDCQWQSRRRKRTRRRREKRKEFSRISTPAEYFLSRQD